VARNRYAGEPFADDDEAIAVALDDVSTPALLCSLVHMTGDPSWIRGDVRPRHAISLDIQSGIPPEGQAEVRARALPPIAEYRDGGCVPHELPGDIALEMMAFLGCRPVEGSLADLFIDDLQLDGVDPGRITWGDEIADETKAASPVVVIGCGMAGILAGIRLQQAGLPFTIVEKNIGPGGTWWENRYPGARVDVGSHQYCYSFEPAEWSEYHARQPELRDYFASVVDRYDLAPHIRFGTAVTRIAWDGEQAMWHVRTRTADGAEAVVDARFVISAVGSLNLPKLPDIAGMDDFAGPWFHSARWPDDLDLRGTRFALVGAGASGFQIGPAVVGDVQRLTVFQRTAQWIIPNPIYRQAVPPGDRWAVRHLPFYARWMRFIMTFSGIAWGTVPYRIDAGHEDPTHRSVNAMNSARADALLTWMTSLLTEKPELVDDIAPDYPALGKRVLQDDGGWLRCLQRPHVELVRTAIERVVADGVVTADGAHHPADVICYATGFRHNDFLASMDVVGRDGERLRERWGDEPTAYLGITVPGFPNLFCMYGPGTNLAAGASLFFHAEFQVHHAMEAIHQALRAGARTCEVTAAAHDDYIDRYRDEIAQLVWSHPSIRHSHYKNAAGDVYTLSPWPLDLYRDWTHQVDRDHYVFG
jgi:4-hydroxyacetophenone monooxygenase